jgi:hypothetical protein
MAKIFKGFMCIAVACAAVPVSGQPLPTSVTVSGPAMVLAATSTPPAKDRCSATGQMGGTKFTALHCAVSLMQDQRSVALWFNEEPLTAQEIEEFQISSYADGRKGGKPRTMLIVMLCPGGGTAIANPGAVKSIDLNTNHAKSPLDGIQTVVQAGKDFKVETMAGDLKPGARLSGKVTGKRDNTSWNLEFDVTLPAKDAAAGMGCGK